MNAFAGSRRAYEFGRALKELQATPAQNVERGAAAQRLAADVAAVHAEIAHVPGETRESAEAAARALEEFEQESRLTLERAATGLDAVADGPRVELDRAIADLLPALTSGRPLPPEDRERLLGLVERVRRVADADAGALLRERLEALARELPLSPLSPEESTRRVERARRRVAKAERAAEDAAAHSESVAQAGARARGRLLEARVGQGVGPAAFEELSRLLVGDMEAAEAGAAACRSAGEAVTRAYVDALGCLDGKVQRQERNGG